MWPGEWSGRRLPAKTHSQQSADWLTFESRHPPHTRLARVPTQDSTLSRAAWHSVYHVKFELRYDKTIFNSGVFFFRSDLRISFIVLNGGANL